EIAVSLPERHYDLAGELLAAAIEDSILTRRSVGESLRRVASDAGREIRESANNQAPQSLEQVLEACGYEPAAEQDGSIVLRNCPFHKLAQGHTDIVCTLNLSLLTAVL